MDRRAVAGVEERGRRGTTIHRDVVAGVVEIQPAIALFGRRSGVRIAGSGPDKVPAYTAATRQLIRHGHRRIVLLCRKLRRLPEPGRSERAFLAQLAAHGCPVTDFNLPDWEETTAGFHTLLGALFRSTPPTALIVDEAPLFIAVQQFLAGRNLLVPKHISLVCTDDDPAFEWCHPAISHIRWAAAVSQHRTDLRRTLFPAEFVTASPSGTFFVTRAWRNARRAKGAARRAARPRAHTHSAGRSPRRGIR